MNFKCTYQKEEKKDTGKQGLNLPRVTSGATKNVGSSCTTSTTSNLKTAGAICMYHSEQVTAREWFT